MVLSIVFVESPLVLKHLVAPFAIVMIVSVVVEEFIIVIKMTTAVLTIGVTRTLHPMLFEALPGSKVFTTIITVVMPRRVLHMLPVVIR